MNLIIATLDQAGNCKQTKCKHFSCDDATKYGKLMHDLRVMQQCNHTSLIFGHALLSESLLQCFGDPQWQFQTQASLGIAWIKFWTLLTENSAVT